MNKSVTLALDMMSGENDPHSSLQAALKLISVNESVNLHLIGNEEKIKEYLPGRIDDRLSIRHTEEVITMKDSPMDVLRRKKESSMRLAVEMVANKKADACCNYAMDHAADFTWKAEEYDDSNFPLGSCLLFKRSRMVGYGVIIALQLVFT